MNVATVRFEIDYWIAYKLARAVISDVSTTAGFVNLN
jgi:hypothetical protein